MPIRFPLEYWQYVAEHKRPKVQAHLDLFPHDRLTEILALIQNVDINEHRPEHKPYIIAQTIANIDAFFHIDEMNPKHIQ